MSFNKIIAVSQRTITISNGDAIFEKNGVVNTAATDLTKNISEWIAYIETATGWTANDETNNEFVSFSTAPLDTLKIKNEDLALLMGFGYNTLITASSSKITANLWGNARLIIQGAENPTNIEQSIYQGSPIFKVPFKNNSVQLAGFNTQNNYSKNNDKESYTIKSSNLNKIIYDNNVKEFYHYNSTYSASFYIFGLEFRIANTKLFNLRMSEISLQDLEERHQTVEFSFVIVAS